MRLNLTLNSRQKVRELILAAGSVNSQPWADFGPRSVIFAGCCVEAKHECLFYAEVIILIDVSGTGDTTACDHCHGKRVASQLREHSQLPACNFTDLFGADPEFVL